MYKISFSELKGFNMSVTYGDSSVLHCALLLCTIFASLACANERMHMHNERNFPQRKFFLTHNNSEHIILFNLKKKSKKFLSDEKKKDIGGSVQKKKNLFWNANYGRENNDLYERFTSTSF